MVAPAKARTPLLGPSGLACAMEMSYRLHSGAQGIPARLRPASPVAAGWVLLGSAARVLRTISHAQVSSLLLSRSTPQT